jgi:serine/threonine protein kinase
VAVALPGYLLISQLQNSVSLNSETLDGSDLKSGGTATVARGKLIDRKLIEQHLVFDVAVKVVHGDRVKEPKIFDSFKYEVTIMSSLPQSPYLVKLVGYSIDPMAIVMKSYAMSLQEALDRQDFFSKDSVKAKAAQEIALGMQIVHSKDIIHFDLKPGKMHGDTYNRNIDRLFREHID